MDELFELELLERLELELEEPFELEFDELFELEFEELFELEFEELLELELLDRFELEFEERFELELLELLPANCWPSACASPCESTRPARAGDSTLEALIDAQAAPANPNKAAVALAASNPIFFMADPSNPCSADMWAEHA